MGWPAQITAPAIKRGDTWSTRFRITKADGTALDLRPYAEVHAQIRAQPNDTLLATLAVTRSGAFLNEFLLVLDSMQSAALPVGRLRSDVELRDTSVTPAIVLTIADLIVDCIADVTR
jgi:hypothetical protein